MKAIDDRWPANNRFSVFQRLQPPQLQPLGQLHIGLNVRTDRLPQAATHRNPGRRRDCCDWENDSAEGPASVLNNGSESSGDAIT